MSKFEVETIRKCYGFNGAVNRRSISNTYFDNKDEAIEWFNDMVTKTMESASHYLTYDEKLFDEQHTLLDEIGNVYADFKYSY